MSERSLFSVNNLSGPGAARRLIGKYKELLEGGMEKKLRLDFSNTHKVFPNGAVPFACALDFMREADFQFDSSMLQQERSLKYVLEPMEISSDIDGNLQLTDVVWKYHDEKEASMIAKRFMASLLDRMRCEEGVYDTLNWCLFEVLDNVFQHSQAPTGYVMMQLHKTSSKCAITVCDSGIGIHRAMAMGVSAGRISREQVLTADQAISQSVKQGVTSKGKLNQGNGLFGLSRSIEINGGALSIHSGKGTWTMNEGAVTESVSDSFRPILDLEDHHGTTVDWQLDGSKRVSIGDILGSNFAMDDLVESIETVEGYHELDALDLEESIGSRNMGREVRMRIGNYLLAGAPQIVLNMKDLDTISSSFADEVLGRLAAELGEAEFRRRIIVTHASKTNLQIINRAIELRVAAESRGVK